MVGVLDVVALRSYVAIADCGGFRRAAENLHLSQSAVSQHVRRLELTCGRELVERSGRGVRFSETGRLLLAEGRRLLSSHDELLGRLQDLPAPAQHLTIGATEHGAELLLPALTSRLGLDYPDAPVRFRIDRGKKLVEGLTTGAIDASVLIGAAAGSDSRPAGALPLAWFAARDCRIGPGPVPLVAISGPCTIRRRALQALADHGREASIVVEAGHLAGVVSAARAGVGVALLVNAGPIPAGLVQVPGLPAVSPEPLHVRGRADADVTLLTAIAASTEQALQVGPSLSAAA